MSVYDPKLIGARIKRARKDKGLTQETLSEILFVTKQAVSFWECGRNLPDYDLWDKITFELGDVFNMDCKPMKDEEILERITMLDEITDWDTMNKNVELLINSIEIDAIFEKTIRKWLSNTLYLAIGYEYYYQSYSRTRSQDEWEDDKPSWQGVGFVLEDILRKDGSAYWGRDKTTNYRFRHKRNKFSCVIEYLTDMLYWLLHEDEKTRGNDIAYLQKVGMTGYCKGQRLIDIMPDEENVVTLLYLNALAELRDILELTYLLEGGDEEENETISSK